MGITAAQAILQQFADRFFPRPLHGFSRAWIISLYPDHILKAYKLTAPPAFVVKMFRLGIAAFFWFGEKVLPDPTTTFIERRDVALAKKSKAVAPPTRSASEALKAESGKFGGGGCPHLQRLSETEGSVDSNNGNAPG